MENFILLGVVGVIWLYMAIAWPLAPMWAASSATWITWGSWGWGPSLLRPIPKPSPSDLHDLSGHVRHHHPGLDHRRLCRTDEIQRLSGVHVLWVTLVYCPVAHWVWGDGGWLKGLGALDFAGGTVVHINAGIAALAAALVVGKRQGYGNHATFIPTTCP